mmetsp:Transcript_83074/g.164788  ORF Transcript_83074/g.164788 Transcript_83074/m.164788 type:complete len:255 (+) Transcript_83074:50-814(+)|eukprot:CAMPEP_0172721820 /NCGR_PEP_ID=MMETSP1074-20121228/79947_1 /TAXON_ID=2916 /ORGANISM="Ceratium fusus, Strain PA161109" /LENGTH=254 /DNA_ID=CAMNT_0013547665 /DNA_START=47 /DNA_END=811 /DNA_ORIENTATION=+
MVLPRAVAVVLLLALLVECSSSDADSNVGTIDQGCTSASEEASSSKCEIPGAFKEEELSLLTLNTHVHRRAHHRPRSYSEFPELPEQQFYWKSGAVAAWAGSGGSVVAVPLSFLLAIVFMLAALGACCLYCLATSRKGHTGNPGSAEALLAGAPGYGATDKALLLNVLAFKDAQLNRKFNKMEDSSDEGSTCPRPEVEEEREPESELAEGEILDTRAEAEWALQIALYDALSKPANGGNQEQILSEATLKAMVH